ncbi:MAG: hypothetical protein ACREC0_12390 [Methylocella sp.]
MNEAGMERNENIFRFTNPKGGYETGVDAVRWPALARMAEAGILPGTHRQVKRIPMPNIDELFKRRHCGREITFNVKAVLLKAGFPALLYRCRQCGAKAVPLDKVRR